LQKSHRAPQKSARVTPWQTSSTDGVAHEYFRHACARHSRKFHFRPRRRFALATGKSALTRPKQQRAEQRAPPTVERCLLPVTPDASGTPIMMQACQNGRGGLRIIRRNAERPRTITHGSIHAREYHLSAAGPPRRARHRRRSQPALPGSKPPPISSVRVCVASCLTRCRFRARKQPHQSRPLGATPRQQLTG
jgi:hypothetical protein